MSGTDDPTHVYWDLENRKGLSCAALREENARLRQRVEKLEKDRMRTAGVLGSPKDADRLPEALGYVLASYRTRAEAAEAKLARVVEALTSDHNYEAIIRRSLAAAKGE